MLAVYLDLHGHRAAPLWSLLFLSRCWCRRGGVQRVNVEGSSTFGKTSVASNADHSSLDVGASSFFALAIAPTPTSLPESVTASMNTLSIRAFIPPLTRRGLPLRAIRCYAVQAPGAPTLEIFSNQHKWMQKERAAADVETSRSVDYLRDEVASRLCERVLVCLFLFASVPKLIVQGHQAPLPSCPRPRRQCMQHCKCTHTAFSRRARERPTIQACWQDHRRRIVCDAPAPRRRFALQQ